MNKDKRMAYWRANLRLVAFCLVIWFVCSYGFGILFVEQLNTIRIGGFQLGFWFAQQGSIYVFVVLIFFYAWRMNRIDREGAIAGILTGLIFTYAYIEFFKGLFLKWAGAPWGTNTAEHWLMGISREHIQHMVEHIRVPRHMGIQ